MNLVVRTPPGDADIEIVVAPDETTLGDLIEATSGQSTPPIALVDSRLAHTSDLLSGLELANGSVIETGSDARDPITADVNLLQVAGCGAGAVVPLPRGRYRVGPGRRMNATELHEGVVEHPVLEISIGSDDVTVASAHDVTDETSTHPVGGQPFIAGSPLTSPVPWTTEQVDIDGRVFELESPAAAEERRRLLPPDETGTIAFRRPPRLELPRRRPIVTARRDAAAARPGLWQLRRGDGSAYQIPFGVHPDEIEPVHVDIGRHRGVAVVGSEPFCSALGRSILAEATTMHGPADLLVAVATTATRRARWDWLKWLPHAASGLGPALFSDGEQLADWVAGVTAESGAGASSATARASSGPLTVLVLDDPLFWTERDSPVRELIGDPPPDVRILVECRSLHEAPSVCTLTIEETPNRSGASLARMLQHGVGERRRTDGVHPALCEIEVVEEIARHLAPLDDLDVATRRPLHRPRRTISLLDLAGDLSPAAISARWHAESALTVAVGPPSAGRPATGDDGFVEVDLGRSNVVLVARQDRTVIPTAVDEVVTAIVAGAANERAPSRLSILSIGAAEVLPELPHSGGHLRLGADDWTDDFRRLVRRIQHVLHEQTPCDILVVITGSLTDHPTIVGLANDLLDLAADSTALSVVIAPDEPRTALPAELIARADAQISLDGLGGGTLLDANGQSWEFTRPTADRFTIPDDQLVVTPAVLSRPPTSLERRLHRMRTESDPNARAPDAERIVAALVRALETGGDEPDRALRLLPPPLPASVDADELFASSPGDGIPLGLVDRPERMDHDAYWWMPGSGGSVLIIGSRRSGMTAAFDAMVFGIATRFSPDDVHVYAFEPLPVRRRALEQLPHCGGAVGADDSGGTRAMIDLVHDAYNSRRANGRSSSDPAMVLMIDDIARLRRTVVDADELVESLGEIAVSGPSLGINVVVSAIRPNELGSLLRLSGDRLVGSMPDPSDHESLGVPIHAVGLERPGRCWSTALERPVQLVRPIDSLDQRIGQLDLDPPATRPPRRTGEESS